MEKLIYTVVLLSLSLSIAYQTGYNNCGQLGVKAAELVKKHYIPESELAVFRIKQTLTLSFYSTFSLEYWDNDKLAVRRLSAQPLWVLTDKAGKEILEADGAIIENSIEFQYFSATNLKSILFPTAENAYLLRITGINV